MSAEMSTGKSVEAVIRQALPLLLVEEYGGTEADWIEMRSVRRIAQALARAIDEAVA